MSDCHPPLKGDRFILLRGALPKGEADFLSAIRTAINNYYKTLEVLSDTDMYDRDLQLKLARDCVLEADHVLGLWRNWKKG